MTEEFDPGASFEEMAKRIRLNPSEFQGAYVVVGPDKQVVANLLSGPKANLALFWSTTKNHISLEADTAIQEAEAKMRGAGIYGKR